MAKIFETGKHPRRNVYMAVDYVDPEGRLRHRRIRIGLVDPIRKIRLYFPDFLTEKMFNGMYIPPDLQKKAQEEMDVVAKDYPELLEAFLECNWESTEENTLNFSIQDIKECEIQDFGPVFLCRKILENVKAMSTLQTNFKETWKDIFNICAFLAIKAEPLDKYIGWTKKADCYPPTSEYSILKDYLGKKGQESFLEFYRCFENVQEDSEDYLTYNYVFAPIHDGKKGQEAELPWIEKPQFVVGADPGGAKVLHQLYSSGEGLTYSLMKERNNYPSVIVEKFYNLDDSFPIVSLLSRYQQQHFVCEAPVTKDFFLKIIQNNQIMEELNQINDELYPKQVTVAATDEDSTPVYLFFEQEVSQNNLISQQSAIAEPVFGPLRMVATNYKLDILEAKRILEKRSFLEEQYCNILRRMEGHITNQNLNRYPWVNDFIIFLVLTIKENMYSVIFDENSLLSNFSIDNIITNLETIKHISIKSYSLITILEKIHWDIYTAFGISNKELKFLEKQVYLT
jgi:hypothetical protein